MGSVGVDFVCCRCWLPSPFDGYHIDGFNWLVCSPCTKDRQDRNKLCEQLYSEARDHSVGNKGHGDRMITEEWVITAEKRQEFLRGQPPGMNHWLPYVQAVHALWQWEVPLPKPTIQTALNARSEATVRIFEEVPVPHWVRDEWGKAENRADRESRPTQEILDVISKYTLVAGEWFPPPMEVMEKLAAERASKPPPIQEVLEAVNNLSQALGEVVPIPQWAKLQLAEQLQAWDARNERYRLSVTGEQ